MRPEELKQIKDLLKDAKTEAEIAQIAGIVEEAKGRISIGDRSLGFWEEKTPCWEMFRCPEQVRDECPAFAHRSSPCWEVEGTYCKLSDNGARGDGTEICEVCRVYKRWGQGEPIHLKLFGKGFNAVGKVTEKVMR
jgi:hypothetical protein